MEAKFTSRTSCTKSYFLKFVLTYFLGENGATIQVDIWIMRTLLAVFAIATAAAKKQPHILMIVADE
jgi:hypothetical protein